MLKYDLDDLVHRSKAGESRAFGLLYEQTVDRVYSICIRMSGNASDAEDLVQEVYVRCWEKLALFHGDSRFTTWLHRLTINHALNRLGKLNRIASFERSVDNFEAMGRTCDNGLVDLRLDLESALSTISSRARKTLMLKYVGGYMYKEIAEMEDLAIGTLKAQVHRASKQVLVSFT